MHAVASPVTTVSSSARPSNSAWTKQYGFTCRGDDPVLGQHDRIPRLPLAAPGRPVGVRLIGSQPGVRWRRPSITAAASACTGRSIVKRRLRQLGRVHVHHDLVGVAGEVLPGVAHLADVEPAAQDQQEVGVLHGEVAGPVADRALAPHVARVVSRHEVVRVESGDDRDLEAIDQSRERIRGAGEPHAGRPPGAPDARRDGAARTIVVARRRQVRRSDGFGLGREPRQRLPGR